METLSLIGNAFAGMMNPMSILLLIVGVAVGIVFGSIPGLSAAMAVALFLPVTFAMQAHEAFTLLVALYIGGISGGLISAILINIPGTSSSIATCFDGSPMAKKGEAGKALGTGVVFSFLGGLFSFLVLMFVAPSVAQITLKFSAIEYFGVCLFALSMIAALAGTSMIKGLLSGCLGLIIALVGMAPIDGTKRFTFGINELSSGFDILPTLIGIFAIAEAYEQTRNYQWYSKSALRHHIFEKQDGVIPMEGFGFERSDANFSNQSTTKNIAQLDRAIDSLELTVNSATTRSYEPLLREQIFANDNQVLPLPDSARIDKSGFRDALIADSIARLGLRDRDRVWGIARANAKNSRGLFSFDESTAKEALNQLYRSKIEWHRKISLPISIMIFFLIGAPLGAIIRKGGLGTPIVISVIFFVIYYIISISGEKAAREGNWEAFYGMWLSSFILAPIAVYLTYKATNDSVLLDVDWYTGRIKYYKEKWGIHTPKWMSALAGRFKRKPEENK